MVLGMFRKITSTQIIKKIFGNYHKMDQEILDVTRALLCIRCYESGIGPKDYPDQEKIQTYLDELEDISPKVRKQLLSDKLNGQLTNMFQCIYHYEELDKNNSSNNNNNNNSSSGNSSSNSDSSNSNGNNDNDNNNDAFIKQLKDINGFTLEVCESALEGAGKGLFANGDIAMGRVVTFFAGTVYLREYLNQSLKQKLFPDDNMQLIGRKDHHFIDCRDARGLYNNPYGLGNYVNHVPANATPNVVLVPLDFNKDFVSNKSSFPSHLTKYIPLKYYRSPSKMGTPEGLGILYPTLALVSTRPIEHEEEILMDYRLNPARQQEIPSWYSHHDKDAARRWRMSDLELDQYLKEMIDAEKAEKK